MTTLPVQAPPRVSATLRPLSGYERLFLAVDIVNGFNFAIAVTFSGVIAHSRWQAAFAQLQKRHPLLNATVNFDDWHAPFFEYGAGEPIPLTFMRRTCATDWQRVMEREIAEPFDFSVAPLLRAAIVEDDAGCDLVITANHVIADGIGVLALIDELLRALAGHTLEELPHLQSAEERVAAIVASEPGLALDAAAIDEFAPAPTPRAFASRNRKGKNTISALRFSTAQSAQLLDCARRNQTTIGAVLLAALAFAIRKVSPDQSCPNLQWSTPINARPYLGNEGDLGHLRSGHRSALGRRSIRRGASGEVVHCKVPELSGGPCHLHTSGRDLRAETRCVDARQGAGFDCRARPDDQQSQDCRVSSRARGSQGRVGLGTVGASGD